jgi:hypothetical protein
MACSSCHPANAIHAATAAPMEPRVDGLPDRKSCKSIQDRIRKVRSDIVLDLRKNTEKLSKIHKGSVCLRSLGVMSVGVGRERVSKVSLIATTPDSIPMRSSTKAAIMMYTIVFQMAAMALLVLLVSCSVCVCCLFYTPDRLAVSKSTSIGLSTCFSSAIRSVSSSY